MYVVYANSINQFAVEFLVAKMETSFQDVLLFVWLEEWYANK